MRNRINEWWRGFKLETTLNRLQGNAKSLWTKTTSLNWRYLLSFGWFATALEGVVSIVLKLGTLLLVVLFLVFFLRLFKDQGYFIQAFSVPKQLNEQGYTGQVIAVRVHEKLELLKAQAGSVKADSLQLKSNSQDIDLSVLGVGLSLRSLAFQLREALGQENKVLQGEITQIGNRYEAQIRMTGFSKISSVQFADADQDTEALDRLFKELAEGILYHTDPYRLALVLRQEDRYEEAIQAIRHLLKTNPEEAHWAYLGWGAMLRELDDVEGAIEKYHQALEVKPDFSLAHVNLAYIYQSQEKIDQAIAAFRRTLELEPDAFPRRQSLAWCYFNNGAEAQADSLLGTYLESGRGTAEDRSQAAVTWAEMYFQRNKFEEAKVILDQHYTLQGENVFSYLIKGVYAFVAQDTIQALVHFKNAFELDPSSEAAINANIDFAGMLNRNNYIFDIYRKAKWDNINPYNKINAFNGVAMTFNEMSQHDSAMALIRKTILIDTTLSYPYTTLAETYFFQGQLDSCMYYMEKALALGFDPQRFSYDNPPYTDLRDQLQFQQLLARYQKEEVLNN